ncbi:MAG: ATP-binding protein [Porphyromonadaceae bacterium]|nr:ATP-binding protein [Porphyromonadaceae bacterium]
MELNNETKTRIIDAVKADRDNYPSDAKHAIALGITASVYSNIKKGNTDRQLGEAMWLGIARRLGVALRPEAEWLAVETEAYLYITGQLRACQEGALSVILCDIPNIGKTFTARIYAKSHRHVAYIDCSQVKTKRKLVRRIAQEFGVGMQGTYHDVYADLVYYLQSVDRPLIILDEAGDLQYEAFLELKALWNATEHHCGWYMMGADGLKAKIDRSIDCAKVGYAEIFSRYGSKYSRVTPDNGKDLKAFLISEAIQVAQANTPEGVDAKQLARKAGGLRRVYTEIMKLRHAGA